MFLTEGLNLENNKERDWIHFNKHLAQENIKLHKNIYMA
jgi:hypothetical protein